MSTVPEQSKPESAEPRGGSMNYNTRIDSLEQRTATLEAQQNWLHLEQLRAEVGGLRQTMDWLIEYVAGRDGSSVTRVDDNRQAAGGER